MAAPQRRILVATADRSKLVPVVAALRATPHSITVASPADADHRLGRGQAFDLLIVDIEEPCLSGFEVIRTFRAIFGSERPVIALSEAFKREHIEGMLENVGAQRLFPLSVRPEELLFWVNNALFPEAMRSRRTPRIPARLSLSIAEQRRVLRGKAFTLSEDGMFLETGLDAVPGDRIELRFRLPGKRPRRGPVVARCEVVWANPKPPGDAGGNPPFGLGLRFLDLDEASRREIQTYVVESLLAESIQ